MISIPPEKLYHFLSFFSIGNHMIHT
jgi:hypothetical protein